MAIQVQTQNQSSGLVRLCDQLVLFLLGLTILLIPIFFIIYTRDQFELPKLTILRMLTSLMLGLWGTRIIASGQWTFRKTPLDIPILVWLAYQVITTVFSVSRSVSFLGEYENFRGLLTVMNYAILYFIATNFIRTRTHIDRLLFVIFIAGLIITFYGIAQFFRIDFIQWNPNSIAPGRYFSTLGNPNFLAAFLAMVMPLTVIFFIETKSIFRKVLLFFSFIIMFWALMGTDSRGGLLGLVTALLLLAAFGITRIFYNLKQKAQKENLLFINQLFRREMVKHKLWLLLISSLLVILIAISATFGKNHIMRVTDSIIHAKEAITRSRLYIWKPAIRIIKDYPIMGTGLDTFKTVFPRYATPEFARVDGANVSSRTAHNEILQVLACQGIIGLIIVTWLTVMILINWRKAYLNTKDNWRDRLILIGLLASWSAYSIQNVFSFGVVAIDTFYWMIIAFVILMQSSSAEQEQMALPQTIVRPLPFRYLLMILCLGSSLWLWHLALNIAIADYHYNIGSLYHMQKKYEACLHYFKSSTNKVPLEVKYRVYYGLAHEEIAKSIQTIDQKKQWIKKAIAIYHEGLQMNPTNAYYLGNLGRAYGFAASLDTNNADYHQQAVYYFNEAIRYAPVTVLFYVNLAMTHLVKSEEKEFFDVLDRLSRIEKTESATVAFNAANQFYQFNLLANAVRYYQKALDYKPDYIEALFNLGIVSARLEDTQQAIGYWEKILTIQPDFKPAQQMLERYRNNQNVRPSTVIINQAQP